MSMEFIVGAVIAGLVVMFFAGKYFSKKLPKETHFECARCGTLARHTDRTIEAWRNNKTAFFASPVISNGYVPGRHASVSLALFLQGPDLERDQVALALLCCLPSFRWLAFYWCTRMPDPFLAWCALPKTSGSQPASTMLLVSTSGNRRMTVLRRRYWPVWAGRIFI